MKRDTAYHMLLEISDQLRSTLYERKIMYERLRVNGLTRKDTGQKTLAVKDLKWTNITFDWLSAMSNPAMLFIIKNIVPALKEYNLLYHRPVTRNKAENRIIKELIDKSIMLRTEVPGIYLMNPLKIWRGNPILCVEETKELLRVHKKPSIGIITDRRPGKDDYTHLTSGEQFHMLGQ